MNPKNFCKDLKTELDNLAGSDIKIGYVTDIPNRLVGDFSRFSYLIKLLFSNRVEKMN